MVGVKGTILTLGGGGFSMLPDDATRLDTAPLDAYLLGLCDKERPRICFIGTAGGDSPTYTDRFHRAFDDRAETSVLRLFGDYTPPSHVLTQDIVYVGGGSTANLLALWRLHGLDAMLTEAAENGTILAGISAGMNCWFEASSTDSFGPLAPLPDGLGLLPGSACPHYFGEEGRAERFRAWIAEGVLPAGHAADDGVALLWRDGVLVEAVSEKPGGQAFRVTPEGETAIPVRHL